MDDQIYHMEDVAAFMSGLNPHLRLKEAVKNIGEFTIDLVLSLGGNETRVKIPMDTFRNYAEEDKKTLQQRIAQGYILLLRQMDMTA